MLVDEKLCVACGLCVPYCTVGALTIKGPLGKKGRLEIDQDTCVECDVCYRVGVCPTDALYMPELEWPRVVRRSFSDPLISHDLTGVPGRGTEEMKTNDVTGRFAPGEVGVAAELGRPGVSTSFRDVERVAMGVAALGVEFEPDNPVTGLMSDVETGKLRDDVLDERALSAIVEFVIPEEKLSAVLAALKEVAEQIDTVFSLEVVARADEEGRVNTAEVAAAAGFTPRPNGKTNLGLGRPRSEEAVR